MISLRRIFSPSSSLAQLARPCAVLGSVQHRFYSDRVHEHFQKPRNVGALDGKDPQVGTAIVGKASCGDVIKLQVRVEEGVIQDVKFKAFGCGSAIASSSYASELIKGKTCDEALKIRNIDIAEHLSLPPVKIHCSLLAEDAVRHAIENYRSKSTAEASSTSSFTASGGPSGDVGLLDNTASRLGPTEAVLPTF